MLPCEMTYRNKHRFNSDTGLQLSVSSMRDFKLLPQPENATPACTLFINSPELMARHFLGTVQEAPLCIKSASFSIDQALEKLDQAIYNNKLHRQLSGATSFLGRLHS